MPAVLAHHARPIDYLRHALIGVLLLILRGLHKSMRLYDATLAMERRLLRGVGSRLARLRRAGPGALPEPEYFI